MTLYTSNMHISRAPNLGAFDSCSTGAHNADRTKRRNNASSHLLETPSAATVYPLATPSGVHLKSKLADASLPKYNSVQHAAVTISPRLDTAGMHDAHFACVLNPTLGLVPHTIYTPQLN